MIERRLSTRTEFNVTTRGFTLFRFPIAERALRSTLLATAAGLLTAPGAQASIVWRTNGHEYAFVSAETITWTAARAEALALGSGWDLATLTSADEEALVRTLLPVALPLAALSFALVGWTRRRRPK